LSYLANTQTDRQTNKVWQKHNLLGGGNNSNKCSQCNYTATGIPRITHKKLVISTNTSAVTIHRKLHNRECNPDADLQSFKLKIGTLAMPW